MFYIENRWMKILKKAQYICLPLLFKHDISPALCTRCYSTWPINTMLIKCMPRHWTLTRSLSKIRCLAMQVSSIFVLFCNNYYFYSRVLQYFVMLWLRWNIVVYYRSESMNRQDIVIPVFCLTTWAGKMGLSCPLRISHVDLAISPFGLSLRWLDLFSPHSFFIFLSTLTSFIFCP